MKCDVIQIKKNKKKLFFNILQHLFFAISGSFSNHLILFFDFPKSKCGGKYNPTNKKEKPNIEVN